MMVVAFLNPNWSYVLLMKATARRKRKLSKANDSLFTPPTTWLQNIFHQEASVFLSFCLFTAPTKWLQFDTFQKWIERSFFKSKRFGNVHPSIHLLQPVCKSIIEIYLYFPCSSKMHWNKLLVIFCCTFWVEVAIRLSAPFYRLNDCF